MSAGAESLPTVKFLSHSEADTDRFGRLLCDALRPGSVVCLAGHLGAGKTRLVRAVATAAGVDPREVTSPTFMLVQEYAGRWPIFHFDTYRLASSSEFLDLGTDEILASGAVVFVEWGDRVTDVLPADHLRIDIAAVEETSRRILCTARGPQSATVLKTLAESLS